MGRAPPERSRKTIIIKDQERKKMQIKIRTKRIIAGMLALFMLFGSTVYQYRLRQEM